ncbi:MAG: hypothetical protein KJ646_04025 [Nanoarchaeota archaeon]|nr:hypothetical protein [Nanoarchaeota archaeon]MBU4116965.1 hypothetical protein [Nanoarchaeota archaeon]
MNKEKSRLYEILNKSENICIEVDYLATELHKDCYDEIIHLNLSDDAGAISRDYSEKVSLLSKSFKNIIQEFSKINTNFSKKLNKYFEEK